MTVYKIVRVDVKKDTKSDSGKKVRTKMEA